MRYLLIMIMLAATVAQAGAEPADQPEPRAYLVSIPLQESSVLVVPDGSGRSLDSARDAAGQLVDATIELHVVTAEGSPISAYPPSLVWLRWDDRSGTVDGCLGQVASGGEFRADAETDADGRTAFSLPLRGGGWTTGTVTLYLNGEPAVDLFGDPVPPINLRANSPDISGDLVVDLTDITLFAQDYGGGFAYRSDFNWDGAVDLSDLVVFVAGLGAGCP